MMQVSRAGRRRHRALGRIMVVVVHVVACGGCSGSDGAKPAPSASPLDRPAAADPVSTDRKVVDISVRAAMADRAAEVAPIDSASTLPDPEPATEKWLASEEAAVTISVLRMVAPLGVSVVEECDSVAADLDRLGTPQELRDVFLAAPDIVTRDVLTGFQNAVIGALSACGGEDFPARRAELAWQWMVVDQRLRQLGWDG